MEHVVQAAIEIAEKRRAHLIEMKQAVAKILPNHEWGKDPAVDAILKPAIRLVGMKTPSVQ